MSKRKEGFDFDQRTALEEFSATDRQMLARLKAGRILVDDIRGVDEFEKLMYLVHFGFADTGYTWRHGLRFYITQDGERVLLEQRGAA